MSFDDLESASKNGTSGKSNGTGRGKSAYDVRAGAKAALEAFGKGNGKAAVADPTAVTEAVQVALDMYYAQHPDEPHVNGKNNGYVRAFRSRIDNWVGALSDRDKPTQRELIDTVRTVFLINTVKSPWVVGDVMLNQSLARIRTGAGERLTAEECRELSDIVNHRFNTLGDGEDKSVLDGYDGTTDSLIRLRADVPRYQAWRQDWLQAGSPTYR